MAGSVFNGQVQTLGTHEVPMYYYTALPEATDSLILRHCWQGWGMLYFHGVEVSVLPTDISNPPPYKHLL